MDKWLFNDIVMMYGIWNFPDPDYESMLNKFMDRFRCDKNTAMEYIETAKNALEENAARRKFVVSYMHYTGENYGKLDSKQMWKIYCAADGYGWRRASELREINGGWDWSHIRDSTIDGWKRMEKKLKSMGF